LDFPIEVVTPMVWNSILIDVLRETPTRLSQADLLTLGRAASRSDKHEQAYLASAAGLESATGTGAARFLLLRAWALPDWASQRRRQCLRAASDLARLANDSALLNEIAAANEEFRLVSYSSERSRPLGEQLLADVLKREREARTRPRDPGDADRYVVAIESERRRGLFEDDGGNFADDYDDDNDDQDDDDEDDDESDVEDFKLPSGLPGKALPVLFKMFQKYGDMPPEQVAKKDPALALELFAAIQGLDLEPGMMEAFADLMKDAMSGKPPKKRKRRR